MEKTTTCSPALRFACTSTACVLADSACLPADFLKVRLQLQNELLPPSAPRLGVVAMARTILQKEGVLAFWSGLPAAATRQFCYGGLSFFAYPFIKDALPGDSVPTAVAAGALSGGGAAAVANPTDVVKLRLQADGRRALEGLPRRYDGVSSAFRAVVAEKAFWSGLSPNVARASFVNGAGLFVYDYSKALAREVAGDVDTVSGRLVSALAAGVATAAVGAPFDCVKTRLMSKDASEARFRGPFHCVAETVRHEGPRALYKGFWPMYGRQAPFNLFVFMILEGLLDLARPLPPPTRD